MSIKQIKSLVQFARASSLVWEAMTIAIPDGVAVFSLDDGAFKIGDGTTMYQNLPTLFDYEDLITAQTGVSSLFKDLTVNDNGKMVVVALDESTSKMYYAVSATSLSSLLNSISNLETVGTNQSAAIADLMIKALTLDAGINTAPNNNIIVVNSGRFSNSGISTSSVAAQVAAGVTYIPGSRLEDPEFYTDIAKTIKADKEKLNDNTTYYIDVVGYNNNVTTPVFTVTCQNTNVTITNVAGSLFSVAFNNVTEGVKLDVPVVLFVSFDDGTGKRLLRKSVSCKVLRQRMMISVLGSSNADIFFGNAIDKDGNIICVGTTKSEGLGGASFGDALIVKYDANLNVISQKRYGGVYDDVFARVVTDKDGNIFVAGWTYSEGWGNPTYGTCLVMKFDTNLNMIVRKVYGHSYGDQYNNLTVDSVGNIICVGNTASEGGGGPVQNQGLIVKYDNALNIIAKKHFGGSMSENIYGVVTDNTNNIYLVGNTYSEGTAGDALIMKFDSSLNVLIKKRLGGAGFDNFRDVCIDNIGDIYAVGYTESEGTGGEGLVVRYDSDLNIISKRRHGGTGAEEFYGCCASKDGSILVSGYTSSEGGGLIDGIYYRITGGITITQRKRYGGSGEDYFYTVCEDKFGNICLTGRTASYSGNNDALLVKLPPAAPAGTFTGTKVTGLVFDGTTTITNAVSSLTDANVTFTASDSNLNVASSGLTFAKTNLTNVKDYLN